MRALWLAGVVVIFAGTTIPAWATTLHLVGDGTLSVEDRQRKENQKIPMGTISEQIRSDGQIFRLSYGREVSDLVTILIYSDPEFKAPIQISFQGMALKLSEGAVLTIRVKKDGTEASFIPGLVGTITLNGRMLKKSGYHVETKPDWQKKPVEKKKPGPFDSDPVKAGKSDGIVQNQLPSIPPIISGTCGEVLIDTENDGSFVPLKDKDPVPIGAVIKTVGEGTASLVFTNTLAIRLSPGTTVMLMESGLDLQGSAIDAALQLEHGEIMTALLSSSTGRSILRVICGKTVIRTAGAEFFLSHYEPWSQLAVSYGEAVFGGPLDERAVSKGKIACFSDAASPRITFIKSDTKKRIETLSKKLASDIREAFKNRL